MNTIEKQTKLMRKLGELLSQDLGYIYGERESGPNGAKKEFLDKGARFLKQVAIDIGLHEFKIVKNPAGIAVSGEVTLMGIWQNSGIMVKLSEPCMDKDCVLYREIKHIKDYSGGRNKWQSTDFLLRESYDDLTEAYMRLHKEGSRYGKAA